MVDCFRKWLPIGRFATAIGLAGLIGGCAQPVLTVDDAVYIPGEPSKLVAFIEWDRGLGVRDGIENADVDFNLGESTLATARADENGRAEAAVDLPSPDSEQRIAASTRVGDRWLTAARPVFKWDSNRSIVAVDIDRTVCDVDYLSVVAEDFDTGSEPIEGAVEALQHISEKYHIVYFTARPRFLLELTRSWLHHNGFPAGPVITMDSAFAVLQQGEAKVEQLKHMHAMWPNLLIGIGDKLADVTAYGENGMLGLILAPAEIPEDRKTCLLIDDWADMERFLMDEHANLHDPQRLRDVLLDGNVDEVAPQQADGAAAG